MLRARWVVAVLAGIGLTLLMLEPADETVAVPSPMQTDSRLKSIPEAVPRLAVLAFTNVGSPDDSFFADGITDELNSRLSGLGHLAVLSRSSAHMYRGSQRTIREIGRALGADYLLYGTVRWDRSTKDGTVVRVTPKIVRVADDTQIWSTPYDRPFHDSLSIQSEIAMEVVAELDIALSARERAAIETRSTRNPLAYEAYLKAIQVLPQGHGSEQDFRKVYILVH